MSPTRLILRSLRHYWRTHAGVLAGAAVSTAIIVGALLVGDSVDHGLRAGAAARLGRVKVAMYSPGRSFRAALADDIGDATGVDSAAILRLAGVARAGEQRANRVEVYGAAPGFWRLSSASPAAPPPGPDEVHVNTRLATRLGLRVGSELRLRVERPSPLSRDLPIASDRRRTVTLRLTVAKILGREALGRFDLRANQVVPYNAFVAIETLQARVGLAGRANLVVLGGATADQAGRALRDRWQLADGELTLRKVPGREELELITSRIYLEPPVAEALRAAYPEATGVLTYLVNAIRIGDRSCPYSMVAAIGPLGGQSTAADDEIRLSDWLAEDLGTRTGTLQLEYFEYGSARKVETKTATARIAGTWPLATDGDRTLMPEVEGFTDADSLADWDAPIPIDTKLIRDKDEAYWDEHRGTPKATLSLAAGQKLWGSRFGSLTAVRFAADEHTEGALRETLRAAIAPERLGLFFTDVAASAEDAANQAIDFGPLFIGLSFFLVAAALILTALLFALGIEQRRRELGLLLALGLRPGVVRRLMLGEAAVLAFVGAVLGTVGGVGYTWVVLKGLSTIWSSAVAGAETPLVLDPQTLAMGPGLGAGVALAASWIVSRRAARTSARALMAGEVDAPPGPGARGPRAAVGLAGMLLVSAAALPLSATPKTMAPMFFGAGGLLLTALILAAHATLARLAVGPTPARLTLGGIARRSVTRRRGRSLAVITLLACGSFLVVAIGAMQLRAPDDPRERLSGTGGFTLYGESSTGVFEDLGGADGQAAYGVPAAALGDVSFVQLRVRDGDDASCLNLNGPQTPRLLGVPAGAFEGRFDFGAGDPPWHLLEAPEADGAIPAIGDAAMIQWSLKKAVGDTLTLRDGQGQPLKLRLVAAMQTSVLQGSLLISEAQFTRRFPGEAGYRAMLIDTAEREPGAVARALESAPGLADGGLELVTTRERLAAYNAVQNTYLLIFQALGALGLLLGSVGMGLVVLRNVLERRGELAQLRAIGFSRSALRRQVFREHAWLLATGLLGGTLAAAVAILPAVRRAGAVPVGPLAATLGVVALSGVVWTWLAARAATRGDLIGALRHE